MRSWMLALLILGCDPGTTNNNNSLDMARPADLSGPLSQCGHPGDTGNSKGVGAYCTKISDCSGSANICSSLGNGANPSPDDTYFCTIYPCVPDGGADLCGENAECVCSTGSGGNGGCACTPTRCL
jgi:hypothetical protein